MPSKFNVNLSIIIHIEFDCMLGGLLTNVNYFENVFSVQFSGRKKNTYTCTHTDTYIRHN